MGSHIEHLVSSWWHYFGTFWKSCQVGFSCRRYVTGDGWVLESVLSLPGPPCGVKNHHHTFLPPGTQLTEFLPCRMD